MLLLFPGENAARDTMRFAEEIAGYGLWQVDFESGKMACSPNTYRLLGLARSVAAPGDEGEPLNFSTFAKVAHPDDIPIITEIQHILSQGLAIDRQFRVVHSNGRVRSMAIHGEVLINRAGKPERVVGVIMDITRHVESMTASQINIDRVRATMATVGGAIWTSRSDGYCTDVLLRDRNMPVSNVLLGFNWQARIHPDDLDRVKRAWKQASIDKLPFSSEHRGRDDSGQYKWRRSYAAPVFADDRSVREWAGVSFQVEEYAQNHDETPHITAAQIRAARGILNWAVRDLADRAGLSVGVVRRLEDNDSDRKGSDEQLNLIKDALCAGGVDFFVLPSGEASVFPAKKRTGSKLYGKTALENKFWPNSSFAP